MPGVDRTVETPDPSSETTLVVGLSASLRLASSELSEP